MKESAIPVFISYAPEDALLYRELEKQLATLRRQGVLTLHHRHQQPRQLLNDASLILLLLSSDFLADDQCQQEMEQAVKLHVQKGTRIVPILLRPVSMDGALANLLFLPRDGIAVTVCKDRDTAFLHIVQELHPVLEELGGVARRASGKGYLTSRVALLDGVGKNWIQGVLLRSLHHEVFIQLGLHEHSSAVANPWSLTVQETDQPECSLPAGTQIHEVYDNADGQLLILGEPGAGKTTLLLQLTRELLTRAKEDDNHRIPVFFNLSSWAATRLPLEEWLIAELKDKYFIDPAIARPWINNGQIIPLLDGLDEVTEWREACVHAINAYHEGRTLIPLVICCRRTDYDALPTRIKLRTRYAVMIQALMPQDIDDYCQRIGEPVAALRQALQQDSKLQEIAATPLMLSVLAFTYQDASATDLSSLSSQVELRRQIFARYIQRALTRRAVSTRYTKEQTLSALSWLARQLEREKETEFYLERLQSTWLPTLSRRLAYRAAMLLFGGLLGALIGALLTSLVLDWSPLNWIVIMFCSLIYSLLYGLPAAKARPAEAITWSWQKMQPYLYSMLLVCIITFWVANLFLSKFPSMLIGLLVSLQSALGRGLAVKTRDPQEFITPNYGMHLSTRNGLCIGLVAGLIGSGLGYLIGPIFRMPAAISGSVPPFGTLTGLLFSLAFGISFFITSALTFGLAAVLQQQLTLTLLCSRGIVPRNSVQFFDYAAERILLRKVGGGYIFIHRLLREYFASLASPAELRQDMEPRPVVGSAEQSSIADNLLLEPMGEVL